MSVAERYSQGTDTRWSPAIVPAASPVYRVASMLRSLQSSKATRSCIISSLTHRLMDPGNDHAGSRRRSSCICVFEWPYGNTASANNGGSFREGLVASAVYSTREVLPGICWVHSCQCIMACTTNEQPRAIASYRAYDFSNSQ